MTACPYKKIYYNWESGKGEKCIGCYPRLESGMPTLCSESCVGRIRYQGVILYDADKIEEMASVDDKDLYDAQMSMFLDPNDPEVIEQARADGIPEAWITSAQNSPVYKMAIEWKIAFPIHPEYRTLPMNWYVPPLSPVQTQIDQGNLPTEADGVIPKAEALRFPAQYLANLLTAGDTAPVISSLNKMLAMRSYQRSKHVEDEVNTEALQAAGITADQAEEMYRYLALAHYDDRFVIPTAHEEYAQEDMYAHQGQIGLTLGNSSSAGISKTSLFPERRTNSTVSVAYVPAPKPRSKG
jgi:nitrate reductase beta subunit